MYVNSELNPADHASRGMTADKFIKCQNWISGPVFDKRQQHWPVSPDMREIQKSDIEIKCEVNVNVTDVHENPLNKLICHYSDWHCLKKGSFPDDEV